ncbi:MAG: protein-glutamate O-methyltransferase CheR [Deltaproteobacteria bacterium]|nr:protein-glutamate O-methyltransferase CheR [Deltaproteobacteria bacterium]
MAKIKLHLEIFKQLRDFIYEKCGISFQENKIYLLEDRLGHRLQERNLSTFEEYVHFLRYDPRRDEEIKELYKSVTTNETSFFRDPMQLDAFRTGILPKVLENKNLSYDKKIKMWSAACSTGEEPYTLAMIMMEEAVILKGFTPNILASDISEGVLQSANRAAYGEYSTRNIPELYRKKYFSLNGAGQLIVNSDVKNFVRFDNINLIDHIKMRTIREMDVIFCRNVLIYFDDNAKKKVLASFYDSLAKGGYLVIGFSESLFNLTRAFKPVSMNRIVVYQKA